MPSSIADTIPSRTDDATVSTTAPAASVIHEIGFRSIAMSPLIAQPDTNVTIWAAEQYGEQDSKGSLEPGKLADLVILDRNPLAVEAMAIKDIRVVETIKEGAPIYPAR